MAGLPGIRWRILGVRRMLVTERRTEVIDHEWFALILEAKKLGLSLDAVRDFLNQNEDQELKMKNS